MEILWWRYGNLKSIPKYLTRCGAHWVIVYFGRGRRIWYPITSHSSIQNVVYYSRPYTWLPWLNGSPEHNLQLLNQYINMMEQTLQEFLTMFKLRYFQIYACIVLFLKHLYFLSEAQKILIPFNILILNHPTYSLEKMSTCLIMR